MAKLLWDQVAEHFYETGDDHAVVYPFNTTNKTYDKGYAWNGITGVTESPSGADENALYADNIKYLSLRAAEEFGMTVTAYTYPDEFAELDGSAFPVEGVRIYQQARKTFGFSYRSIIGNDAESNDYGYKLHLIYGLTASPSERSYASVNDSPEAIEFSWEMTGVPVAVTGYKNTCILTIDSTKVNATKLKELEDILYGTDGGEVTYEAVTPEVSDNPVTKGWYERTGTGTTEDPYVYTLSADTTVDAEKTYYEKVTSVGTDARLPLPDEVITLFQSNNVGG